MENILLENKAKIIKMTDEQRRLFKQMESKMEDERSKKEKSQMEKKELSQKFKQLQMNHQ